MDKRFPAACRLARTTDILAVFARRDLFRGRRLVFYRGPILGGDRESAGRQTAEDSNRTARTEPVPISLEGLSRFCVVVSKKCGTAVRRNRIKRIVREIIRHHRDRIPPGFDYVLRVECSRVTEIKTISEKDFIGDFRDYFGWD